jgi:proline iminopeptidase
MRRFPRLILGIFAALLALLAAYVGFCSFVYYRTPAADLPCRECSGEAGMVHVNGFDLYYREVAADRKAIPVVAIHGGPGHSSDSFGGSLDPLADEYRVIYYDQRGSGHSQIKPDPRQYTVDLLVEELETLRREVIGAERVILVGHSAGGAIAQRYAIAHAEHVEKLVLVSSIPANNGIGNRLLWDVFSPALFVLGGGIPPQDAEEADAWFGQLMVETSVPRLFDPSRRSLLEGSGYLSFATWREASRSMAGEDLREGLAQLETQSLVVYGEADSGATGVDVATALCQALPRCRLVAFEASGHWPFLEEPERFIQVIREFLAE